MIGPSPRVRGTLVGGSAIVSVRSVHPRVCGEHEAHLMIIDYPAVHPRVCGEHGAVTWSHDTSCSVHPRVCGEHWISTVTWFAETAVHPRVCGEHQQTYGESAKLWRSIPACAGNTPWCLLGFVQVLRR